MRGLNGLYIFVFRKKLKKKLWIDYVNVLKIDRNFYEVNSMVNDLVLSCVEFFIILDDFMCNYLYFYCMIGFEGFGFY